MTFETGRIVKPRTARSSTYGESVVLVTVSSAEDRPGLDFFPSYLGDYVEKTFAAARSPAASSARECQRDEILTAPHRPPVLPALPGGRLQRTRDHRDGPVDKSNPTDVLAHWRRRRAAHQRHPVAGPIVGARVTRCEFIATPPTSSRPGRYGDRRRDRDAIMM
jgi:polyribonucleotide nucleotidyltransferase